MLILAVAKMMYPGQHRNVDLQASYRDPLPYFRLSDWKATDIRCMELNTRGILSRYTAILGWWIILLAIWISRRMINNKQS